MWTFFLCIMFHFYEMIKDTTLNILVYLNYYHKGRTERLLQLKINTCILHFKWLVHKRSSYQALSLWPNLISGMWKARTYFRDRHDNNLYIIFRKLNFMTRIFTAQESLFRHIAHAAFKSMRTFLTGICFSGVEFQSESCGFFCALYITHNLIHKQPMRVL